MCPYLSKNSVIELYGLCRKRFTAVHKKREDICTSLGMFRYKKIVYFVTIFLEHLSQAMSQ